MKYYFLWYIRFRNIRTIRVVKAHIISRTQSQDTNKCFHSFKLSFLSNFQKQDWRLMMYKSLRYIAWFSVRLPCLQTDGNIMRRRFSKKKLCFRSRNSIYKVYKMNSTFPLVLCLQNFSILASFQNNRCFKTYAKSKFSIITIY